MAKCISCNVLRGIERSMHTNTCSIYKTIYPEQQEGGFYAGKSVSGKLQSMQGKNNPGVRSGKGQVRQLKLANKMHKVQGVIGKTGNGKRLRVNKSGNSKISKRIAIGGF